MAQAADLYATQPDVPSCRAGTLSAAVKAQVLASINQIRAYHNLPAVTYAAADDVQPMEASLIVAANGQLSHMPPTSSTCYSAAGASGAGSSNLLGGVISPNLPYYTNDDYLAIWMIETSNLDKNNVGHRRWILDPFLGQISYGRVAQQLSNGDRTDAAALKVFSFSTSVAVPTGLPGFVAYPYGDYPARLFNPSSLLSFSVIADVTTTFGANATVDYSRASVSVTGAGGSLVVSNISYDNVGYGVPNNIQFNVTGLQSSVIYTVTISNVLVSGAAKSYTYAFRIVPS